MQRVRVRVLTASAFRICGCELVRARGRATCMSFARVGPECRGEHKLRVREILMARAHEKNAVKRRIAIAAHPIAAALAQRAREQAGAAEKDVSAARCWRPAALVEG